MQELMYITIAAQLIALALIVIVKRETEQEAIEWLKKL